MPSNQYSRKKEGQSVISRKFWYPGRKDTATLKIMPVRSSKSGKTVNKMSLSGRINRAGGGKAQGDSRKNKPCLPNQSVCSVMRWRWLAVNKGPGANIN